MQVIGAISGSNRVVVRDSGAAPDAPLAVDLDLELVLGDMPNKTYSFDRCSLALVVWMISRPVSIISDHLS